MKINYKYSPNGTTDDYILTVDGAEIGRVKSKEYAEAIERAMLIAPQLESRVEVLQTENEELVHALRKRKSAN